MTKHQEINLLRHAVDVLMKDGPNSSYTGAWLSDQLPLIEMCILSDDPPDTRALTWNEYRVCGEAVRRTIIDVATADAVRIREDAQKDAEKLRQASLEKVNATIVALGRVMNAAVRQREDLRKLR
jgi:hypothetical protein